MEKNLKNFCILVFVLVPRVARKIFDRLQQSFECQKLITEENQPVSQVICSGLYQPTIIHPLSLIYFPLWVKSSCIVKKKMRQLYVPFKWPCLPNVNTVQMLSFQYVLYTAVTAARLYYQSKPFRFYSLVVSVAGNSVLTQSEQGYCFVQKRKG